MFPEWCNHRDETMTDKEWTTENRECGADVAAYALGSLDADEAESFRHHLESCVVCRDELAAFQQVVDVLPMSAPAYTAPPGLRRRVLDAVAEEPDRARASARRRSARGRWTFAMPRPALAFGTALAVAVAAVVVVLAGGSSSTPPTRVVTAQVTGQGNARLRLSGDHAELVVHRLAAPPAGQIYEVWLRRGHNGTPLPTTALFSVNDQGDADVDVPGNLHGVSQMMVTREPAGGTQKPTHPPVISATLD
jgi:anti-sigma-K factor RskA